jgi:abortive infection bacteriophage resistance protein
LILSEQDIKKIESIASKVRRENKKEPVHDDIVAQMTFGFWCSFFHRKYDPAIWHRKDAVKMIFPNLPRVNRKRAYIENKILTIKEIRNRIAHHEPVWNRKISIIEAHTICHELIHAMSNDAVEMLKSIDRFSSVYQKLVTKPKVSSL